MEEERKTNWWLPDSKTSSFNSIETSFLKVTFDWILNPDPAHTEEFPTSSTFNTLTVLFLGKYNVTVPVQIGSSVGSVESVEFGVVKIVDSFKFIVKVGKNFWNIMTSVKIKL